MHCPGEEPPFRPVQGGSDSTVGVSGDQVAPVQAALVENQQPGDGVAEAGNEAVPKAERKNKIAISIGKGKVGTKLTQGNGAEEASGNATDNVETAVSASARPAIEIVLIQKKRCEADIEKWTERGKEIRGETQDDSCSTKQPGLAGDSPDALTDEPAKIATTAEGKPICLLW